MSKTLEMQDAPSKSDDPAVRSSSDELGGFNVICVNDKGVNTRHHYRPNGVVKKGLIYRVLGESSIGGYVILGKPTILRAFGIEAGWSKWRFKRQSS